MVCYFLSLSYFPSLVIVWISFTCPWIASCVFCPCVFYLSGFSFSVFVPHVSSVFLPVFLLLFCSACTWFCSWMFCFLSFCCLPVFFVLFCFFILLISFCIYLTDSEVILSPLISLITRGSRKWNTNFHSSYQENCFTVLHCEIQPLINFIINWKYGVKVRIEHSVECGFSIFINKILSLSIMCFIEVLVSRVFQYTLKMFRQSSKQTVGIHIYPTVSSLWPSHLLS